MLKIEDLSFGFGNRKVLQNLNLHVKKKEICCIIGSSGSGKTTLFQLIAGTYSPHKGKILAKGNFSYATQHDLLLPWRSVMNNLLLPLELKGAISQKERERALHLLEQMGLKEYADSYPEELSQGMRQRVSLATMLFQQTPLLLLDEPFASLDVALREHLYEMLRTIRNSFDTTILMTTHDFRDALFLADKIVFLKDGTIQKEWIVTEEMRQNPFEFYQCIRKNFTTVNFFS